MPTSKKQKQTLALFYLVLVLMIGALVAWIIYEQPSSSEMDLSRIGKGTPAVVQVHDPGCPSCRKLRSAIEAIKPGFDSNDVIFLVADLTTDEGRWFAQYHEVRKVTLVFFNEKGDRVATLSGEDNPQTLKDAIKRLYAL